jgi:hypothetical protein
MFFNDLWRLNGDRPRGAPDKEMGESGGGGGGNGIEQGDGDGEGGWVGGGDGDDDSRHVDSTWSSVSEGPC